MDIKRQLNNHPLIYVESDGDSQVLTPNIVERGENTCPLEDTETNEDELMRLDKWLKRAIEHTWQLWKSKYIHSLMEQHHINRNSADYPYIGESVFVVGEEKSRGEWIKTKVVRHVRGSD